MLEKTKQVHDKDYRRQLSKVNPPDGCSKAKPDITCLFKIDLCRIEKESSCNVMK